MSLDEAREAIARHRERVVRELGVIAELEGSEYRLVLAGRGNSPGFVVVAGDGFADILGPYGTEDGLALALLLATDIRPGSPAGGRLDDAKVKRHVYRYDTDASSGVIGCGEEPSCTVRLQGDLYAEIRRVKSAREAYCRALEEAAAEGAAGALVEGMPEALVSEALGRAGLRYLSAGAATGSLVAVAPCPRAGELARKLEALVEALTGGTVKASASTANYGVPGLCRIWVSLSASPSLLAAARRSLGEAVARYCAGVGTVRATLVRGRHEVVAEAYPPLVELDVPGGGEVRVGRGLFMPRGAALAARHPEHGEVSVRLGHDAVIRIRTLRERLEGAEGAAILYAAAGAAALLEVYGSAKRGRKRASRREEIRPHRHP